MNVERPRSAFRSSMVPTTNTTTWWQFSTYRSGDCRASIVSRSCSAIWKAKPTNLRHETRLSRRYGQEPAGTGARASPKSDLEARCRPVTGRFCASDLRAARALNRLVHVARCNGSARRRFRRDRVNKLVRPAIVELTEGVLKMMFLSKLKIVVVCLAIGCGLFSISVLGFGPNCEWTTRSPRRPNPLQTVRNSHVLHRLTGPVPPQLSPSRGRPSCG